MPDTQHPDLQTKSAAPHAWPEAFQRRSFWSVWGPLLLALVVGVAFQGTRGLTETSETRYAECAREMLVTGNWMEPQLEFQPHWTKPPVAYWCMAAGMKVFGANAWGARLPGVLALLVATWAVGALGRRLWGAREGFAAGMAFALGFPLFGAYVVTTDIYLAAAETLAGAAFVFAAMETAAAKRRLLACAMWAAWGLAFLIKGPPGLLPLLAFIPWNLMQPRERRVPLGHPLGVACFAAVALPWYLLMLHRHPDLLHYYVGTEIVGRVSTDLGHNRAWYKAIEIYAPALLGSCGAFGVWAAFVAFARGGWSRGTRWAGLWRGRDARLLLVGWVVLPMVVFCLSRSKLHLYILPLVAPLALIAGRVLANRVSWRALRNVALASALAFVAVKGVAGHRADRRDMRALGGAVAAARAELPAVAPIVLWDEAVNHGITFYLRLGGAELPERIAEGEKGKFEHWSPAEFLARCAQGRYPRGALLVVDSEKMESEAFAPVGTTLRFVRSGASTKHWSLLKLPPPVPAAGG
jgi:4-amino-4-deoxy-L-arabinose transferase